MERREGDLAGLPSPASTPGGPCGRHALSSPPPRPPHLDVVLGADDDEARNLVANEDAVGNRDLVLDAVVPHQPDRGLDLGIPDAAGHARSTMSATLCNSARVAPPAARTLGRPGSAARDIWARSSQIGKYDKPLYLQQTYLL